MDNQFEFMKQKKKEKKKKKKKVITMCRQPI
jgi:hypothetical protein